jgi:hypothetical protein
MRRANKRISLKAYNLFKRFVDKKPDGIGDNKYKYSTGHKEKRG